MPKESFIGWKISFERVPPTWNWPRSAVLTSIFPGSRKMNPMPWRCRLVRMARSGWSIVPLILNVPSAATAADAIGRIFGIALHQEYGVRDSRVQFAGDGVGIASASHEGACGKKTY